nr:pantoate--beta-alanine ligase [Deinococcus sp.]
MPVVQTPSELHTALRGAAGVGLVPTMGALHQGHAALIERARGENSVVVVSVFVNPLQFRAGEDLSRYPRDLERDRAVARAAGADLIFHPDAGIMYPPGFSSSVGVGGVALALEGASRPGHFGGVATVVLKLLNLVGADGRGADRAYFGEKDWQQLSVVRQMVRDLNHHTRVVGVPTVRVTSGPASGLALSSRNGFLSFGQQARAAVLSRALLAVQMAWAAGMRAVPELLEAGQQVLNTEPEVSLEYLSVVDERLDVLGQLPPQAGGNVSDSEQRQSLISAHNESMLRVLIAARMYGVRLIDNAPLLQTEQTIQQQAAHPDQSAQASE